MSVTRSPMLFQSPKGREVKPKQGTAASLVAPSARVGGPDVQPSPLPTDPAILAEIRAGIDRGLAQAKAGIGYDLEEVLADMDRKLAAQGR